MVYSGDGINGDGDYFNPIHARGAETDSGALAAGYIVTMPSVTANNYDSAGAQFVPWKPTSSGNMYGVIFSMSSGDASNLVNYNIVLELLNFPSASYSGTPPTVTWSNYVSCSALNTCTYPSDTQILKRQVLRWDQSISGASAAPGTMGQHYLDFRFKEPLAVGTTGNYGFRIFYNALTTVPGWPRGSTIKPLANATNFGLGVIDSDTANASTVSIPLAISGTMVSANAAAVVGGANVYRTQNEHWNGVYSLGTGKWTITGSLSGTQAGTMAAAGTGATGPSWVNDGVAFTTLTANTTASTRLCVASSNSFAANQYIDIWDADTVSALYTIASVNTGDTNCPNSGPSIITTAALATAQNYSVFKNASVARNTWKLRMVQGRMEAFTQDMPTTTKVCVNSSVGFTSPTTGTPNNVVIWDDDHTLTNNRITAIATGDTACTSSNSITVATAMTAGSYSSLQNAKIAEIGSNVFNSGDPSNNDTFRFSSINMGQNPTKTGAITNSLSLYYGKTTAPATSQTNYPWIANLRHPFYLTYGDIDTSAPVDGDFVVVGGGASDPDPNDSPNLTNDLLFANISPHTVTVDKNFDTPLVYTGNTGGGVGVGATTAATTTGGGSGYVSMLLTTRTKLTASTEANKHYRFYLPGKLVLGAGATLEFGSSSASYPQTSTVDIYQDSTGPTVSTTLGATLNAAATTATLTSVDGFYIGDVVLIKDDDTSPIQVLIGAINPATKVITFVATTTSQPWVTSVPVGFTYTAAKNATVTRGSNTERSTGSSQRSQILTARNYGARNNFSTYGTDSFRTARADLAVDIDGNIDTGYLGAQQTTAGNTWLDVSTSSGTLAGNWSVLDPISVAQGTNYAVSNNDSSIWMGANDDASAFPTWTGGTGLGGNADAIYNPELTEIGTIPLTNIYNYDIGTTAFSSNYATLPSWTIFGDNANTEVGDAVYFGDQGNTPLYALEFNVGVGLSADATRVWEYWNGSTWTTFTPSQGWKYEVRGTSNSGVGEYCMPLTNGISSPMTTIQVNDTSTYFRAGQYAKIKADNAPTIIRRISSVTAGINANTVFTEMLPTGYSTSQNAKICIQNGGRWIQMDATSLFVQTGRTLISWNTWDMATPAKTTINGISAYWVRNRISAFNAWTTSPTNQATPVGMQGVETQNAVPLTVSNQASEAHLSNLATGVSFNPNETWILRYNDNATHSASLTNNRWYESQTTSWGTAHRWKSPNNGGNTTAYYEKNAQDATWRTFNGSFSWTDYSVATKFYMNQPVDSVARRIGIALRETLDDYGYGLLVSKSTTDPGSMRFYTHTSAGTMTGIGSSVAAVISPYNWYCLKAQAIGTSLQAKIWTPESVEVDCANNEPGTWGLSTTNATYTTGRFALVADTVLARFDDVLVQDTVPTTIFADNFNDTGCWHVTGSIHGNVGCAYNNIPYNGDYLSFTIKHKGGVQSGETGTNAVIGPLNAPEEGDEIYVAPVMKGSGTSLDVGVGISISNTLSKYENWDFVYSTDSGKWNVTGSQYGSAGTATPGTTYTSPGREISLKIGTSAPAGTKFGARAAYFQNTFQRGVGNITGLNNQTSAILIQPTWVVTGSPTMYNIEGTNGVAAQKGTIDFWFKPNFTGNPDYLQYLFDYASNSNTDRISVRITPLGKLEFILWGAYQVISTPFSATAGTWYHFRGVWADSDTGLMNKAYAFLDGAALTTNQGSAVGARAANAGMIRLGNNWLYNAGFDGAMDELAIFNDAIDTGTSFGTFSVPTGPWTNGQQVGNSVNYGSITFLEHFDDALERQKGFLTADYYTAHPAVAFTNGADTLSGERIRVVTYPQRTRIWTDNTGTQYTPSARIKYSAGYGIGAETGWGTTFQYHHRAASSNASTPISSPVLNLRRQVRFWSDEDIHDASAIYAMNSGLAPLLYYPKDVDVNHAEFMQLYNGLNLYYNPQTGATTFSTQKVKNNAFNNVFSLPLYTYQKTLGSTIVDNNNYGTVCNFCIGFRASGSSNITYSSNYLMGGISTSQYLLQLNGGRNFTLAGNKLFNNYYPMYLVLDANSGGGAAAAAKITMTNNEFWRYRRGITLAGNVFLTMTGNTFDGGVSSEATNGYYGTALYVSPGTSNMEIYDTNSFYGRSIWNEVDMNMPEDTTSYLAGSLFSYKSENTVFNSPFHYLGLSTQDKFGGEYLQTAIPGVDVRYSSPGKDVSNFTNFGTMRTTGTGLADTTVRTAGGYGWRMESSSKTDALEYSAKAVGVSGKPLAITGYIRVNSVYGSVNAPTVTLSGLGMTGTNLTWTADLNLADQWQQFVVSGTPTESALATLTVSIKSTPVIADSGTAENVDDAQGITIPTIIEDTDKNWTFGQWAGYKMRDDQGFVFDIIGNTPTRLFLKGSRIPFANVLPAAQPYGNTYEIYSPPYVYLDDISVLSGTVDTGTLDYYSQGQPVSPWLSTGLTAEGVWNAQTSSFASSNGTFGQVLGDALVANYADVVDVAPTTTTFSTDLLAGTDNYYNDGVVIFTEGANKGVVRRISDYTGSSKTIVVDPALPFAPANSDRFAILAATASSQGITAADIWGYTIRSLTDASLGVGASLATKADVQGLNNISAFDVWSYANKTITGVGSSVGADIFNTACAALSSSGTIGKKVCDNLDAQVSLTAAEVWGIATQTIVDSRNVALSAIWSNATDELSNYVGRITAAQVWNVLVSNLTLADSIGKLLVTNVDDQISERATQTSVDSVAVGVSTRASQVSLDTHEAADAAFRTSTTTTLGLMTADISVIKSDLTDIETKIDTLTTDLTSVEAQIATIGAYLPSVGTGTTNQKLTDTYNKVVDVSSSLQTVTDRIGKVSVDSFTQLFEVKKDDITYLKNKIIELKTIADIDRQLLEKSVNEPIVKVLMEWGSVIIKFVIVNPSGSTAQRVPFKAFLPKEVKQEYIIDSGGLTLNYDTATEQYYVTADINLKPGEAVTRAVEIKDIWIISEDEVASLRKQADEMAAGLKGTAYFAQGLTLKTDINTRLDKVVRKQKENNATPQDHILAYRENQEDVKGVQDNLKGLKDLVLNSGASKNFLASIGGIQTFATWGIVIVLIFGMGVLGSFYYSLWKRKTVAMVSDMVTPDVVEFKKKGKKITQKTKMIELPTPAPWQLPGFNLSWVKNIIFAIFFSWPKKFFVTMVVGSGKAKKYAVLIFITLSVAALVVASTYFYKGAVLNSLASVKGTSVSLVTPSPVPEEEVKAKEALIQRMEKVKDEEVKKEVETLLQKTATDGAKTQSLSPSPTPKSISIKSQYQLLVIKQTPPGYLNVREKPSLSSTLITKIYPGESYPFSETQNGWYKIILKDLKEGWISGQYIRVEAK